MFRYKSAINPDREDGHSTDGRWTYDVFFVMDNSARLTASRSHFRAPRVKNCHAVNWLGENLLDSQEWELIDWPEHTSVPGGTQ